MTIVGQDNLTTFPPFESHTSTSQDPDKHDSPFELTLGDFTEDNCTAAMASTSSPFIKPEPTDFDMSQFMNFNNSNNNNSSNQHQQNFNGQGPMNINPQNLSQSFGQQGMTSSFNMGNSGIADDELLELQIDQGHQGGFDFNNPQHQFGNGMQMNQQSNIYSQTPDGAPIQSPFTHDFNYAQFRPMPGQQFGGGHSMPQQTANFRQHMHHHQMDRKISADARSPGTPHTPGIQNLHIQDMQQGVPQQINRHRQQGSIGGGWDSTPSGHSWNESSPFNSPVEHMHQPQISEVLKSTTHHHKVGTSLPAKMEGGPGYQTQEAKRRRRRESHNLVERRRRDNINERIQDLGNLVPQHRLEDEKVRKHLQTNAPLSPSITNSGLSPPAATSLLATSGGRRATGTGSITQGLPLDDKEKGPNKGDILNGSVAWTRDLMWYLQNKLRQEEELKTHISQLGGVWPYEQSEEEKRMHCEIMEVISKQNQANGGAAFTGYSRAAGTGLRVPGFTNVAGESINSDGQVIGGGSNGSNGFANSGGNAMSPGFQSGSSGVSSGNGGHQQPSFWNGGELKEEDEYNLEM
ncbi:hypothetical protein K431DRAFT_306685 [Polychaeton citri CBS 116435]|uniref:BHLH domain-containing protein n=1 Tax=Polychaeton citri CBS 116435 TaxID=1314669 RepID=A0A9P4Q437_9PEZI|nr:hypothetical protein K431DRAFT_306685 [Polychaeton citri CBS 116435]